LAALRYLVGQVSVTRRALQAPATDDLWTRPAVWQTFSTTPTL
jgi:hypothetical protein